ncbi:MAG: type II toxin-antitoxin system RelE/ParE family toxin [Sulfobacillus sp.]
MLRHADWTALVSDDVEVWLLHCHPEKGERARIIAKFRHVFDLLRAFGPALGKPHVDRIEGEENLWEVRVGHRTGAYRAFFGLATGVQSFSWSVARSRSAAGSHQQSTGWLPSGLQRRWSDMPRKGVT